MHQGLRRIFVCLLALAFLLSGATWRNCIDASVAQAAPVVAAPDHQHDHYGPKHGFMSTAEATHDHGGHVTTAAKSDQGQLPANDHACLKCCSMCTVTGLTPGISTTPAVISTSVISFRLGQRNLVGHAVALDPGIPKPIV